MKHLIIATALCVLGTLSADDCCNVTVDNGDSAIHIEFPNFVVTEATRDEDTITTYYQHDNNADCKFSIAAKKCHTLPELVGTPFPGDFHGSLETIETDEGTFYKAHFTEGLTLYTIELDSIDYLDTILNSISTKK